MKTPNNTPASDEYELGPVKFNPIVKPTKSQLTRALMIATREIERLQADLAKAHNWIEQIASPNAATCKDCDGTGKLK